MTERPANPDPDRAREVLLELCRQAGPGRSITPQEAAEALLGIDWRRALPRLKQIACDLARAGEIEILRKGKPVDPAGEIKGVVRYRVKTE